MAPKFVDQPNCNNSRFPSCYIDQINDYFHVVGPCELEKNEIHNHGFTTTDYDILNVYLIIKMNWSRCRKYTVSYLTIRFLFSTNYKIRLLIHGGFAIIPIRKGIAGIPCIEWSDELHRCNDYTHWAEREGYGHVGDIRWLGLMCVVKDYRNKSVNCNRKITFWRRQLRDIASCSWLRHRYFLL